MSSYIEDRSEEVCEPCTERVGHTRPKCEGLCSDAIEALIEDADFSLPATVVTDGKIGTVSIPVFIEDAPDLPTIHPTYMTFGKRKALVAYYPDGLPKEARAQITRALVTAARTLSEG